MVKAKIVKIEPRILIASGESYLDVAVELIDSDLKKPILRNFGFAKETTAKEIRSEVDKFLKTYQLEKVQSVENKEVEALDAYVADLQENLEGEEVAALEEDNAKSVKKNGSNKNATKKGK